MVIILLKLEDRGAFSFYVIEIRGYLILSSYVSILHLWGHLGSLCPNMKLRMKKKKEVMKKKEKMKIKNLLKLKLKVKRKMKIKIKIRINIKI